MEYFPLFADLQNRTCLVVGETRLAESKAAALAAAGARVRRSRRFEPSEAQDVFLIVADVDEHQAEQIRTFADDARVFLNVIDKPRYCSFIAPAILERGDLLVAISTSARSPGLAAWLREELGKQLGVEYAELLSALGETRALVRQSMPSYQSRRDFYRQLFEGDLLDVARLSGKAGVKARLREALKDHTREIGR